MMDTLALYLREPDKERGKLMVLAKQMGLDISELTDEEIAVIKACCRNRKNI